MTLHVSRRARITVFSVLILLTALLHTDRASAANAVTAPASRSVHLRAQLAALTHQGASAATIRKRTGLVRVSTGGSAVTPYSDNSSLSLGTPTFYYDSVARDYYVAASWSFAGGVVPDWSAYGSSIGGADGFGLRFSANVNNEGGSLYLCPSGTYYGSCTYASNYAFNSAAGVSWTFQDKGHVPCPCAWFPATGSVTFNFKPLSSSCLQAFTDYAHTWNSTRVTGFGLNTGGFSIAFSTTSSHWEKSSSAGHLHC